MKNNFFKKAILIGMMIYLPFTTMAWGLLGHRIVGQIADSYLTKRTKKAIKKILGNESVAMSSNWADFIKSNPSYGYLYNWHFVNLKGGLSEAEFHAKLDADTSTDAYTKINFITNELKNNKALDQDTKVMYLRLLIHIVGDVHQPLHIGHLEDKGGNTIKILWFGESENLHTVWDTKLIDFQQLSYTEYAEAINHPSKEQRQMWEGQPMQTWYWESYQLADKVYASIKEPDQKLSYKYNYDFIGPLNEQLLKGGIHLASLLNEIFN